MSPAATESKYGKNFAILFWPRPPPVASDVSEVWCTHGWTWVTAVTPTDRPKSVRNRCVIEVFGGVFYVVTLLFGFFYECRGVCHRTESDLFLFLLQSRLVTTHAYHHQNILPFVSGTELQTESQTDKETDGRTYDPITTCPGGPFKSGTKVKNDFFLNLIFWVYWQYSISVPNFRTIKSMF